MSIERMQRGFTLVEMIVAIVIIGVGVTGVLAAYMNGVKGSADAVVGKQLISIAEEMMEEILLKPHSLTLSAGNGGTTCGASAANRSAFDDIGDYNAYQTSGICDIDGASVAGLGAYGVSVVVQTMTLNGVANTLRVTVTASHSGQSVVLDGFKTALPSA